LYLTLSETPWGGSNEKLAELYKQANGECPLIIDKSSPSCGGSRFGCWTCTVIKSDKSMQGFVEGGDEWMKPLLEFRNWLAVARNSSRYRSSKRRDGKKGLGPFTLRARRMIFERLIRVEETLRKTKEGAGIRLIAAAEKRLIEELWWQDGYRGPGVAELEVTARVATKKQ
jgi:DNA sulfur modification protein DndC